MKMKKAALVFILLFILILVTSCGGESNNAQKGADKMDKLPVVLDQAEYILFQNIFYNEQGSQYAGKSVTKNGIFGRLVDAYDDRVRYYVWGYLDNTKCCGWQWEFDPADKDQLPPPGSLIQVKGTFVQDNNAMDDYWIAGATVTTETEYTGPQPDVNMSAMSDTLELVQIYSIIMFPDAFEGKSFSAYGRVRSGEILEDPYYDGSWTIGYSVDQEIPAFGTIVTLDGNIKNGTLAAASIANRD